MLRFVIAALVTIGLTGTLLFETSEPAQADHPLTVPQNFVATRVASSISGPTAMAETPDGRLFVSRQTGQVLIIENDTLLPTPWGSVPVEAGATQGLFGIAFDPNFVNNGYTYVFHTLRVGTNLRARVSRYTTVGNLRASGATTIWESPNLRENTAVSHYGGDLQIGNDGKLYISFGDDLAVSRPQDLNSVFGKILRINLDGTIPTDNPFYTQTSGKNQAIYALGARNPFKMAYDDVSDRLFFGDVGRDSFEEINDVVAGGNYGWPTYEGSSGGAAGFVDPLLAYAHDNPGGLQGCASAAGDFYNPDVSNYPSIYAGQFFASDFCEGWIKVVDPDTGAVSDFGDIDSPLDLVVSANGSLYALSRDSNDDGQTSGGSVWKYDFVAPGAPVVVQQPQSQTVTAGTSVTLNVTADGDAPLSYQWQRNGADIAGATGTSYTFVPTLADDEAQFRVLVSNGAGSVLSNAAELQVNEGGGVPAITFDAPLTSTTWGGGDDIAYAATVTDPEDGVLPASALTWTINLHHDDHFHPVMPPTNGIAGGTLAVPTAGETSANVWFRFILDAEDSSGNETTSFIDIFPRTKTLTLETNPPGLTVTVDGETLTTPTTIVGVEGIEREMGAFAVQELAGQSYTFNNWSTGEARDHVLFFPDTDTTLTANFTTGGGGGTAPAISTEPADAEVFAGATATFAVEASGDAPLTYQWQREGIDIPGATGPNYTTPATSVGDDFAGYRVLVTNDVGTIASRTAILLVTPGSPRVTDDLTGLWEFAEGSGTTVADSSGFGVPLDLTVADPANVSWMSDGGISIVSGTDISSDGPATKIIDASVATDEITIEAWVTPAQVNPTDAGRIAGLTDGSSGTKRNAGISQGWWSSNAKTRFDARVRTTGNYNNAFNSPTGSATTDLTHVVLTRSASGLASLYVDGVSVGTRNTTGDFVWHDDVPFVIGNELSGNYPFLGDVHLVATYSRALTAAEIVTNFDVGVTATPPTATPPSITSQPSNTTVTEGDFASFTVVASGDAPLTYQWTRNGSDIAGATAATFSTEATLADSGDVFAVTVSNAAGSVTSANATLTVDEAQIAPAITGDPTDQTVTEGDSATFTATAIGSDPLAFQWKRDGADIAGATSDSYTLPTTTLADDQAQFSVSVSNGAGSVESAAATLTVESAPVPPTVVTDPADATVTEGAAAVFTVDATGDEPLDYDWRRDGTSMGAPNSSTLIVAATTLADNGAQFDVVVSNDAGSVTSAAATLTVLEAAGDSRVDRGLAGLWNFSEGAGSTVADSSGFGTPLDLTIADPGNVAWLADGGLEITSATQISSGVAATKLLDAIDANGEVTFEGWVTPAGQNPSQAGRIAILGGGTNTSHRNGGIGQGWWNSQTKTKWTGRVRTSATNNNALATTAGSVDTELTHVVLTGALDGTLSLYVDGELQKTRNLGSDFAWTPTTPLFIGNEQSGNYPFLGSLHLVAIYSAELTAAEVLQNFDAGPTSGGGGEPPTNQAPVVDAGDNAEIEFGEQLDLNGSYADDGLPGPSSAVWSATGPGSVVFGDTTAPVTTADFDTAGVYTVTLTVDDGELSSADSIQVEVAEPSVPPTIVTEPTSVSVPVGDTATFSVTVTGDEPLTFEWRRDGTPIAGAPNVSTFELTDAQLTDSGAVFSVVVSNSAGTVTSTDATLTVTSPGITVEGDPTVTVEQTGIGELFVSWEADPTATLYQIRYRPDGQSRVWFPPSTDLARLLTGLESGLNHRVEVRMLVGGTWGAFTRVEVSPL